MRGGGTLVGWASKVLAVGRRPVRIRNPSHLNKEKKRSEKRGMGGEGGGGVRTKVIQGKTVESYVASAWIR